MVHSLTCPCMNVCVHLEEPPKEEARAEEELRWVNEAVPRLPLKGLARGTKSVAGHTAELPLLIGTEVVKDLKGQQWECVECLNCCTVVFLHRLSSTGDAAPPSSDVIINVSSLARRLPDSERDKLFLTDKQYNPHWRVRISDHDHVANTVVDAPDPDSGVRYSAYMELRRSMRDYLRKEEKETQARIAAYAEEQNTRFTELQAKMFSDRKILWHRLSKLLPGEAEQRTPEAEQSEVGGESESDTPLSTEDAEPSGVGAEASGVDTKVETIKVGDMVLPVTPVPEDFAPPPSDPAPLPPAAAAGGRRSSNVAIFSFEDFESPDVEEADEEEAEEERDPDMDILDDGMYDFRPKRGDANGQFLACSMPVTIPPRFSAFGHESRTKKGGASMEDEDVYGKSFQVPDKRSRQMV